MKKRNAFTLVELLAIIAILGVIAILVLPNINSNSKKEKEYDKIVTTIKSAAKLYHINNKNATKVYISTLISDEYLSSGIINPITDDVITGCVVISKNANNIYEFEYISSISECNA